MIIPPDKDRCEMLRRNVCVAKQEYEAARKKSSTTVNAQTVKDAIQEHPIPAVLLVAAAACLGSQLLRAPLIGKALRFSLGALAKGVLAGFSET